MASSISKAGLVSAIAVLAMAGTAQAEPGPSAPRTVQGTWYVQVTPRNCFTGAQVAPPIVSLVTFHKGGTLTEAPAATVFAPGQRTPGHGTWERQPGGTYEQRFAALIAFTTAPGPVFGLPPGPMGPGFEAGWQTVTQTVRLLDHDHLESDGTNAFYRTDGTLYRSGCSTATGTRFE